MLRLYTNKNVRVVPGCHTAGKACFLTAKHALLPAADAPLCGPHRQGGRLQGRQRSQTQPFLRRSSVQPSCALPGVFGSPHDGVCYRLDFEFDKMNLTGAVRLCEKEAA